MDAEKALADFAGVEQNFVFEGRDGEYFKEQFAGELEDFKNNFGFDFEQAVDEKSPFYVLDKIVDLYDEKYSTEYAEYDMWQWACKDVLCEMAHEIEKKKNNMTARDLQDCLEDLEERYFVYATKDEVVSDGFLYLEDAENFAKEHNFSIIQVHRYYRADNGKLYPNGDPEIVKILETTPKLDSVIKSCEEMSKATKGAVKRESPTRDSL